MDDGEQNQSSVHNSESQPEEEKKPTRQPNSKQNK